MIAKALKHLKISTSAALAITLFCALNRINFKTALLRYFDSMATQCKAIDDLRV
jgi:hypothetical protein